jgi:hypothetical protein
VLAAIGLFLAGMTLAAWPTHPSTAQRAADLRGMVHDLTTDIQSCAGGVTDSMAALHAATSGGTAGAASVGAASVGTAESIVTTAVSNCSPVNNTQLEDLIEYPTPESLSSYHLTAAVQDMWTWATPLAQRVQSDAGALITARGPVAVARAAGALRADQRALDAERTTIDKLFTTASRSLAAGVAPPPLPG